MLTKNSTSHFEHNLPALMIEQQVLSPLEVQLAQFVYQQAGSSELLSIDLACCCILLYRQQLHSSSCMEIKQVWRQTQALKRQLALLWEHEIAAFEHTFEEWRGHLLASPLVATVKNYHTIQRAFIVYLPEIESLSLQRQFHTQQCIAIALLERCAQQPTQGSSEIEIAGAMPLDPSQKSACERALNAHLHLICGGPGSGKTTTVFALLNAWLKQRINDESANTNKQPLIKIAACTGKAAMRLNQALQQQLEQAPKQGQALLNYNQHTPLSAQTVHRTLGFSARRQAFRYHQDNPLKVDLLLVDEASMLDFKLLRALLAALPSQCQLIFLGDAAQLPAIEPGDILGCMARSPLAAQHISYLSGQYRFANDSAIAQLLDTVARAGTRDQWQNVLHKPSPQLHWLDLSTFEHTLTANQNPPAAVLNKADLIAHFTAVIDAYFERINSACSISEKLEALEQFKILTPFNEGPLGTQHINRILDEHYAGQQQLKIPINELPQRGMYSGRPILITHNDYNLGLFNGDTGLILYDVNTASYYAWFVNAEQQPQRFHIKQLNAFSSAYAMSVHKAQGSEFEHLFFILPNPQSERQTQLLQRSLIYTAISRARRKITLLCELETLHNACLNQAASHHNLDAILTQLSTPAQQSGSLSTEL